MSTFNQGFSLLLWVNPDSTLICTETLSDTHDSDSDRTGRGLLSDACVLLGMRWGLEFTISDYGGTSFGFGVITRFTVSNSTITRALGDLADHISFLRGNAHHTFQELVRYKECKEKWHVPDQVTESYSGQEDTARPQTSTGHKRQRY